MKGHHINPCTSQRSEDLAFYEINDGIKTQASALSHCGFQNNSSHPRRTTSDHSSSSSRNRSGATSDLKAESSQPYGSQSYGGEAL